MGRAQAELAAPAEPSLTARVRALYEASVVPVREIAAIAGVSERTLYKYVERGGWRRRNRRRWNSGESDAAGAAADAEGAAGVERRAARGTGGRFIPLAQAHLPHASGLKALDPQGAMLAGEACALAQARERALVILTDTFLDLMALWHEQEARAPQGEADEAGERFEALAGALGRALVAQIEQVWAEDRAGRARIPPQSGVTLGALGG